MGHAGTSLPTHPVGATCLHSCPTGYTTAVERVAADIRQVSARDTVLQRLARHVVAWT